MGEERDTAVPVDGPGADVPDEKEAAQALDAALSEERERYLCLAAEFDNFRKRAERDALEFRRRAKDDVLLSLLEVLDNLDRALESSTDRGPDELLEGLKAIRNQMSGVLSREGFEPIVAIGQPFDPFEMEAVMRMPSDEVAEGDVVGELQRGYRGKGYVLRHSKVIVSSGPPEPRVDGTEVKVTKGK